MIVMWVLASSIHAQCLDEDAHNTSLKDMWVSCETFPNPLGELGNNHWIMYEFDDLQSIENIEIWNLNHPEILDGGIKSLRIDYSPDGGTWNQLGTVELDQADGSSDYIGAPLDLQEFEARYVLLTSLENHGGQCTGLSEVRFNLGEVSTATKETYLSSLISISPNPADQAIQVAFGEINTRDISYQLVDMSGKVLYRDQTRFATISDGLRLDSSQLPDGHYTLHLQAEEGEASKQIIVAHPK